VGPFLWEQACDAVGSYCLLRWCHDLSL